MNRTSIACLHCGEPCPSTDSFSVLFDGQQHATCCPGCQAVAQTILEAGLTDFYRGHRVPGRLPPGLEPQQLALDELELYDEPELQARYVRDAADPARFRSDGADAAPSLVQADLAVEGMHCGACVWLIERGLAKLPGVASSHVNFSSERAHVVWDPSVQSLSGILKAASHLGYRTQPFDSAVREQAARRHGRDLLQRLFVAALIAMQAMMFALPEYLYGADAIEDAYRDLLRGAGLVLSLPVLLYSATPFFAGAWRDLRSARAGMDVPVAIALGLAYLGSVRAVASGNGDVYFDSIAMFTALLLGARYFEWRVRRRASATLDALSAATPETARLVDDEAPKGLRTVPVSRLRARDIVRVDSGAVVPADAYLVDESAEIDQSLLTGESVPVLVRSGQWVPGGSLLMSAPVDLQVARAASESTLSVIARLAERGASGKPRAAQMADRVASVFVPIILGLALTTGLVWAWLAPQFAWPNALAVLVVSCPCALSLATPTALAAAHASCLRRQLILAGANVLEAMASVTDVVFDKTGTLTEGRPELVAIDLADGVSRAQVLGMAAGLESGAAHPFARTICQQAEHDKTAALPVRQRVAVNGAGVAATIASKDGLPERHFLGAAHWCGIADVSAARQALGVAEPGDADSEIWLTRAVDSNEALAAVNDLAELGKNAGRLASDAVQAPDNTVVIARLILRDRLRTGAHEIIESLRRYGVDVHLLSGDRTSVVNDVATALAIQNVRGQARPEDKQTYVRGLQARGRRVMMIGDGINDMPVLASADVSVAFGESTSLIHNAADVVVLQPHLSAIDDVLRMARQTRAVIRQNLSWAFIYNLSAIPLAALGWVPPWLAAIGMALSSLAVVLNAARLLNDKAVMPLSKNRVATVPALSVPSS